MKKIFSIISLFIITTTSAQDHLEPVGGIFNIYDFQFEYYSTVRKTLFKNLSDRPSSRFLVMPSFGGEAVWDIDFDSKNRKYYLITHECETSIWYAEDKNKVKVKELKKEINQMSAELINKLFLKALKQVRYKEKEISGFDGTNYYFINFTEGEKAGTIWSPRNIKMEELVAISSELFAFTASEMKVISFDQKMIDRINSLIGALE